MVLGTSRKPISSKHRDTTLSLLCRKLRRADLLDYCESALAGDVACESRSFTMTAQPTLARCTGRPTIRIGSAPAIAGSWASNAGEGLVRPRVGDVPSDSCSETAFNRSTISLGARVCCSCECEGI